MNRSNKVLKFFFVLFLVLLLLVSLVAGVLREVKIDSVLFSDYVVNFLALDKLEALLGDHYFNSIFCSMSGSLLTTLIYIIVKGIKSSRGQKKAKRAARNRDESIITKIPPVSKSNPTQGGHNLKF